MFDNYIIEIRPRSVAVTVQAGIIVRDSRAFRFFAATDTFNALEGQLFKSPKAAEHAVLRCARAPPCPLSIAFALGRGRSSAGSCRSEMRHAAHSR